eukprot:2095149-Amphidinium_carterae.1
MSCAPGDLAAIKKQLASLEKKLGSKPAGTQQPNKGGGKGTRRGGGRRNADTSEGWKSKSQRGGLVARSAGTQGATRRLFGGRPQEAYCSGQGFTGPAIAVADCTSCCATAKTGNPSDSGSARPLIGASSVPCRQDGPASEDCARSDSKEGTAQGGTGYGLLGLGLSGGSPGPSTAA